jgi:hypothetical protein
MLELDRPELDRRLIAEPVEQGSQGSLVVVLLPRRAIKQAVVSLRVRPEGDCNLIECQTGSGLTGGVDGIATTVALQEHQDALVFLPAVSAAERPEVDAMPGTCGQAYSQAGLTIVRLRRVSGRCAFAGACHRFLGLLR